MLGFSQLSKPIKWQDLLEKEKNACNAFRTGAKISEKKHFGVGGTLSLSSLYGRVLILCGNCKSNVMIRGKYQEKILSESREEAANRPSSIFKYSGYEALWSNFMAQFYFLCITNLKGEF